MKPFFYLLFLSLAACGVKHSSVDYGKTTVSDLISSKGEPLEERSIPVENSRLLVYPENQKFQVKGNLVTHGFKDPVGDEKNLIYWKHKFKDCDPHIQKISEGEGHKVPEYELKCPEQGISVIYAEGSEFVSRIIEHEKK